MFPLKSHKKTTGLAVHGSTGSPRTARAVSPTQTSRRASPFRSQSPRLATERLSLPICANPSHTCTTSRETQYTVRPEPVEGHPVHLVTESPGILASSLRPFHMSWTARTPTSHLHYRIRGIATSVSVSAAALAVSATCIDCNALAVSTNGSSPEQALIAKSANTFCAAASGVTCPACLPL